jgi:NTE family protein
VSAALVAGIAPYLRAVDPGVVTASGLERAEDAHDRVVLTAPYDDAAQRDFCLRSADRVVLVSSAPAPPEGLQAPRQDCDLVLTAPSVAREDLLAWHELARPISVHRTAEAPTLDDALRALSARLAQRAIGLVLAGGGARSFAHIGVIEEFERAGIVIDRVAGTSAGAWSPRCSRRA